MGGAYILYILICARVLGKSSRQLKVEHFYLNFYHGGIQMLTKSKLPAYFSERESRPALDLLPAKAILPQVKAPRAYARRLGFFLILHEVKGRFVVCVPTLHSIVFKRNLNLTVAL